VRHAIVEKIVGSGNGGFGSTFNVAQGVEMKRKQDFDDSKATLLKDTLSQVNGGKIHPVSDGAGNKQGGGGANQNLYSDSDDD
jgi:hypothetical protein